MRIGAFLDFEFVLLNEKKTKINHVRLSELPKRGKYL